MAEISDPQLNVFCNETLRRVAASLVGIDANLSAQLSDYNAKGCGNTINTAGSGNLISDGSAIDGRTRRVGGDVYNMVTLMTDLKAFFDATGRRDVLIGWGAAGIVNGTGGQ